MLDLFEVIALECPLFSTRLFDTIVNERMRTYCDEVEYKVILVKASILEVLGVLALREGVVKVFEF